MTRPLRALPADNTPPHTHLPTLKPAPANFSPPMVINTGASALQAAVTVTWPAGSPAGSLVLQLQNCRVEKQLTSYP